MNCPIRTVTIPGLAVPIELTGLIVIVGPNSSGKTQLLQDINEVVLGRKRELVVLSSVAFNSAPDFNKYFELLVKTDPLLNELIINTKSGVFNLDPSKVREISIEVSRAISTKHTWRNRQEKVSLERRRIVIS